MSIRPLLLGHRGARAVKSIPENTLASFDRALADGCDGFEFDVRLTGDGEAVVCHDPRADKVEIVSSPARFLPELPRLEKVLQRYGKRAFLDIELKVAGLEKLTLALLGKHLPRGFLVSSFLREVLLDIRSLSSTIPLGLICETQAQLGAWRDLPVKYVMPHRKLLRRQLLQQIQDTGRKVIVWTVNDREAMRRFAALGVDGIISDDTRLLAETIAN